MQKGDTSSKSAIMIAAFIILYGCAGVPSKDPAERPKSLWGNAQTIERSAAVVEMDMPGTKGQDNEDRKIETHQGTGALLGTPSIERPALSITEEGTRLNFIGLEIADIADAILGEALQTPYSIEPGVQGTLTLQSNGRVSNETLLLAFENALALKGVALIDLDGSYVLVPMAEAVIRSPAIRTATRANIENAGYGVRILSLSHVSVDHMADLLEPFASRDNILKTDAARSIMVVAGTAAQLASIEQAVQIFDVDWMEGMSFNLYHLKYAGAQTLAGELETIFNAENNPVAGRIRLIPIERINALLAITANADHLAHVSEWVERLDLGGSANGRRIYVYNVQNGRAADLAQSLSSILAVNGPGFNGQGFNGPGINGNGLAAGQPGRFGQTPFNNPQGQLRSAQNGFNASPGIGTGFSGQANSLSQAGLRIVPVEDNNSLMILASPDEFALIEAALRQLDITPRQVLIEASVAEVSLTDELRYGVQWFFSPEGNAGQFSLGQVATAAGAAAFPGFSYFFESGNGNINVMLDALASITDVQVVSAPKLLVLNNQQSQLQIGDQVPIVTQSAVTVQDSGAPIVNSVQLLDTGVILSVTPRINDNGMILLEIDQEVSDVVPTTTSGIDSPTVQQRRISSTVAVRNGETLVLGGLIRETESDNESGVPFFRNIPILGNAFKSRDRFTTRTELVILLTPRVLRDSRETQDVMDYLQREFSNVAPLTQ